MKTEGKQQQEIVGPWSICHKYKENGNMWDTISYSCFPLDQNSKKEIGLGKYFSHKNGQTKNMMTTNL